MVSYYISYGEPGSRFNWRSLLLILLGLLALAILAAIVYGIILLFTGDDDDIGIAAPLIAASEASSVETESGAAMPLAEAITPLYHDNANTVFLVDVSKSISDGGNLQTVQKSLLDIVLPHVQETGGVENRQAALMTFTNRTNMLVPMTSLDDAEAQQEWLKAVQEMETQDRPAYIFDAVADAHASLAENSDAERANVIVLLTDGSDGGFQTIDPTKLTPCPADVAAPAGYVCAPASDPVEAGGYMPFDPTTVQPCPAEYNVAPGMACIETFSETSQRELINTLRSDEVPNLIVHTIGFGEEADQGLLKLLAAAGQIQGLYRYAEN